MGIELPGQRLHILGRGGRRLGGDDRRDDLAVRDARVPDRGIPLGEGEAPVEPPGQGAGDGALDPFPGRDLLLVLE